MGWERITALQSEMVCWLSLRAVPCWHGAALPELRSRSIPAAPALGPGYTRWGCPGHSNGSGALLLLLVRMVMVRMVVVMVRMVMVVMVVGAR